MKKCLNPKCIYKEKLQPLSNFYKHIDTKDKLYAKCKECVKENNKKRQTEKYKDIDFRKKKIKKVKIYYQNNTKNRTNYEQLKMNKLEKYEDNLISDLTVNNTLLTMKIKEIAVEDISKDNLENLQKILNNLEHIAVKLKICLEIKNFNNKNKVENGKEK